MFPTQICVVRIQRVKIAPLSKVMIKFDVGFGDKTDKPRKFPKEIESMTTFLFFSFFFFFFLIYLFICLFFCKNCVREVLHSRYDSIEKLKKNL